VFGSGVWATHFVAMLAFESDLIAGYAVLTTLLSFAVVCVGAAGAFWVALQAFRRPVRASIAGVLLGGGIGAMHYIGIGAMSLHGAMSFDLGYVAVSVGVGMIFSALALRDVWVWQRLSSRVLDAAWLSVGIVLLHFTGMTALNIQPAPVDAPIGPLIGSTMLAIIIAAVSGLILALSLFGSLVDQYLSLRLAREQSSLHHLAHHDPLTGLPNRLQCHERLAEMVGLANGGDVGVGVMCLDLDRFKQANDLLGYRAGDQLLVQVAARLQSTIRSTDMVARIGGDEFVVAVSPPTSAASAAALAGRIIDAIGEPF
jgi:diguanylate cyclase